MSRLAAVRLGYGLVLLTMPGLVVRAHGARPGRADRVVAQVLGWRPVVQAAACAGSPGASVLLLGAEADVAHALSAVALAAADRPRRRAGLTEALLACAFAAAGFAAARRAAPALPRGGGQEPAARVAHCRQRVADRIAGLAVPAAVRRWAVRGDAR